LTFSARALFAILWLRFFIASHYLNIPVAWLVPAPISLRFPGEEIDEEAKELPVVSARQGHFWARLWALASGFNARH